MSNANMFKIKIIISYARFCWAYHPTITSLAWFNYVRDTAAVRYKRKPICRVTDVVSERTLEGKVLTVQFLLQLSISVKHFLHPFCLNRGIPHGKTCLFVCFFKKWTKASSLRLGHNWTPLVWNGQLAVFRDNTPSLFL